LRVGFSPNPQLATFSCQPALAGFVFSDTDLESVDKTGWQCSRTTEKFSALNNRTLNSALHTEHRTPHLALRTIFCTLARLHACTQIG